MVCVEIDTDADPDVTFLEAFAIYSFPPLVQRIGRSLKQMISHLSTGVDEGLTLRRQPSTPYDRHLIGAIPALALESGVVPKTPVRI
jgi:hypothetical protein